MSIRKRNFHVSSKKWVLCSRGKNNMLAREILFSPFKHKIHIFWPPCDILYICVRVETFCCKATGDTVNFPWRLFRFIQDIVTWLKQRKVKNQGFAHHFTSVQSIKKYKSNRYDVHKKKFNELSLQEKSEQGLFGFALIRAVTVNYMQLDGLLDAERILISLLLLHHFKESTNNV